MKVKSLSIFVSLLFSFLLFIIPVELYGKNDYENNKLPPQSGQFFKTKPSSQILVADCRNDSPIGKMASCALQGLINQDSASVYLYFGDNHVSQLNDTKRPFTVLNQELETDYPGLTSLFKKFASRIQTIYIWTPDKDWTLNMALMLSAQNKGIPLTKDIAKNLIDQTGWKGEVISLCDNYKNKKAAYNWAMKELMPTCHSNVLFSMGLRDDWQQGPWRLYDYVVASKGFAFWLDDAQPEEQNIIKDICRAGGYKTGAIVMGYAKSGDDLLTTVNEFGIGYVVSDYYANGSFWCSYPNKSFSQLKGESRKVEPGKVYVSVVFSDGDNLQFDQNGLYEMWMTDKQRGTFPIGTTLAPGMQEINPFLMEWYYKHKTENDELVAGPSGYQFIYGRDYHESGYEEWLENNRKWLASGGFHTGCFWHTTYGTERFDRYIQTCGLQGIFDGDDKAGFDYKHGVVIMNQGEHLHKEGEMYNALSRVQAKDDAPVFVNLYPTAEAYCDGEGISKLKREAKRLEKEFPGKFVYMLPKDLTASAAKYYENAKGEK